MIHDALVCLFYRAGVEDKGAVLQQYIHGTGGWIVVTGALGTGINIEGFVMMIYVSRPYGLTSFVQQSGHGGRDGEVSEAIIITRAANSHGRRPREESAEVSSKMLTGAAIDG
jgi:superfamily II DNA helicase RecQ